MKPHQLRSSRPCLEELEGRVLLSASILSLSTNWSGYAVSAPKDSVTVVSGSWNVPAVTGTGNTYAASWVGINGLTSSTVEQIGTESNIANGKPQYYAWVEMYPSPMVTVPLTINANDQIDAAVSYGPTSGQFTLSITDVTSGHSYSTTQSAPQAQRSSAEWIEEAPSSGGVLPLANFGTVNFSAASATIGGTAGPINNSSLLDTQVNEINMISNSGASKATTSGLTDSGTPSTSSFSVSYVTSSSTTPASSHGGHGGGHLWWQTNLPAAAPIILSSPAVSAMLNQSSTASLGSLLASSQGQAAPLPRLSPWDGSSSAAPPTTATTTTPIRWQPYRATQTPPWCPTDRRQFPEQMCSRSRPWRRTTHRPAWKRLPCCGSSSPTCASWEESRQPTVSLDRWPTPAPMFHDLSDHAADADWSETGEE